MSEYSDKYRAKKHHRRPVSLLDRSRFKGGITTESRWRVSSQLKTGRQFWQLSRHLLWMLPFSFLLPSSSRACVFEPPYRLPIPFSIYAWGSSAALCLSFVVMVLFARAPSPALVSGTNLSSEQIAKIELTAIRTTVNWGQFASVALLLLCVATGMAGTQDPLANFNMTFFWVIFVLGVPYATLIFGDFYKIANPWKAIVSWCSLQGARPFAGVLRYPASLGYYPALLLYMAFVWVELFSQNTPLELSVALTIYSFITLTGAWLFGYRDWFWYGDFFGVLLRLLGYVAPFSHSKGPESPSRTRRWRLPFSGLLEEKAEHVSLLLFVLFMLSSTAYDGLHETLPWMGLFWKWIYPHLSLFLSSDSRTAYRQALLIYNVWQWSWLIASPFVYLAIFRTFLLLTKLICKSQCSVHDLSLRFALTLVPIAVVYHITHYYPTLLSQGGQIVRLISDPLGFGWNLFGTANHAIAPVIFKVSFIWGSQVFLIVAGHVISCYLAHAEALGIFPSAKKATLSQIPILLLMVLFTSIGLKILSMPYAPD